MVHILYKKNIISAGKYPLLCSPPLGVAQVKVRGVMKPHGEPPPPPHPPKHTCDSPF